MFGGSFLKNIHDKLWLRQLHFNIGYYAKENLKLDLPLATDRLACFYQFFSSLGATSSLSVQQVNSNTYLILL